MLVNQEKVKMTLVGVDGNAFDIMGEFSRKARRQGWTKEEIDTVLNSAMSGTYDHLLRTILEHTDDGGSEY